MEYTREEPQEAKRQIDSTVHKLRETVKTLGGKGTRQVQVPDHPGQAADRRL